MVDPVYFKNSYSSLGNVISERGSTPWAGLSISKARWLLPLLFLLPMLRGEIPPDGRMSRIADGIQYVNGQPFVKTAAWWGVNHWMTGDPDLSVGNLLALPADKVGTADDFYGRAGFNTGFFSIVGGSDMTGKNLSLLREAVERARKDGQKIVLHVNCYPPADIAKARGWTMVNEDGEIKPLGNSFLPDPKEHAAAMREWLRPYADAVRDEPVVIGYQMGGETWAAASYDDASIRRYREFLRQQFTLEELSRRYLGAGESYKDWDQVFPPIKVGAMDFSKRPLANGRTAMFDWARFNKKIHEDLWVEMVGVFNELDGKGRPISYEYNHGPYSGSAYGLSNFNFEGICARTTNFSVGPGEFAHTLAESMQGLFTKACGKGPWFSNEVDARPAIPQGAYPAYLRRHLWWTLALGGNGYNLWTFFNLLGARNEFVSGRYYDPIRSENLPSAFFEVEHCNRMISSLGPLLAGSVSPEMPVGIFYLEDSSMAGYAGSYKADSYAILRSLASRGLADQVGIFTEYSLENLDLGRFKAIILPRTPRITEAHAHKLADYVARGGTLILMAPTGRTDDLCADAQVFPKGPLAKVAGVEAVEMTPEEIRKAPLSVPWGRQTITLDVRSRLKIPPSSQARPLLTVGGETVVSQNDYGKGHCYYLAGRPLVIDDADPTAAFLCSLLFQSGVSPAALLTEGTQTDIGVYAGRRLFKGGGGLLILIENADRAHDLKVKIDPAAFGLDPRGSYSIGECFGTEVRPLSAATDWSFRTRIEPVGVRVYAVIPGKEALSAIPSERKLVIPVDDPDAMLIPPHKNEEQPPYLSGDAFRGRREAARIETLGAAELASALPRDLGDSYVGLDIDGACNQPLSAMLKDVDYSYMNQFGATPVAATSREALPLKPGKSLLGSVPVWVNGRFVKMGMRNIEGIRVGARVDSLHFFHHGVYWLHESSLGYYVVHYVDGTALRVPIALDTTLSDLDRPWGVSPRTDVIWTAKNGNRLSRYDWVNPFPEKVVTSVDIVRNDGPEIAVWGITAKKSNR